MSDVRLAGKVAYLALLRKKLLSPFCEVSLLVANVTFLASFFEDLGFGIGAHSVSLLAW